MDSRAEDLIRRHGQMVSDRQMYERVWQEVARRVLPRLAEFTGQRTKGDERSEYIFDSTAPLALERFAAAMDSMNTPRAQMWHKLKPRNEDLAEDMAVKRWLERVNKQLWNLRYSPTSNFASQIAECYMQLGAFGTTCLQVEDEIGKGVRYRAIPLTEVYIDEDAQGRIDTVHRAFKMTARQAVQKWGKAAPPSIAEAAEKQPLREFEFIHCVKPNEERDANRRDYRGMPIASYYLHRETGTILGEGGFRKMPYLVTRYLTAPREKYGRSPAMTVLPDIRMINEMAKTILRNAHKAVDPPLLLNDDGALQPFQTRPGGMNFGMVDENGRPKVVPLQTGGDIGLGVDLLEERRRVINDAFLVTLFQVLVEGPQMTATEVLQRAQEKGALLGPIVGRLQTEMLGPMIERELDILNAAGALDDMPDNLVREGGDIEIEYDSPITRAMKAEENVGLFRTIEGLGPISKINPNVMRRFNWDEIASGMAANNGLPAKWVYSDEEMAEMQEREAAQQQLQEILAAAPVAAQAAEAAANVQQKTGVPIF